MKLGDVYDMEGFHHDVNTRAPAFVRDRLVSAGLEELASIDARLVIGGLKQGIDLRGRHPDEFPGQRENGPHRQALSYSSVVANASPEVGGQELVRWSHRFA